MTERADSDARAFVLANTRMKPVPDVPEISLHVADQSVPLWQKTEEELGKIGLPPPFWAFAWAGGQALARFVLDHRASFARRRVLDIGSGSGLVAIAAAKAGAVPVVAADTDPFAAHVIALNAAANGVYVEAMLQDLLPHRPQRESRYDFILAGDLFYERDTAARVLAFLDSHAAFGTRILIGDPGRAYLPRERLLHCCEYRISVARDLEDMDVKPTSVWALREGQSPARA